MDRVVHQQPGAANSSRGLTGVLQYRLCRLHSSSRAPMRVGEERIWGDLPPSSSVVGATSVGGGVGDHTDPIWLDPTKPTWSTPACAASAAPASAPIPVTTLNTPGGKPASYGEPRQFDCGARCLIGGLGYRAIAHRDRGGYGAGQQLHRVFEGDDVAGDSERLPPGVDVQIR